MQVNYLSTEQLEDALPDVLASPRDGGKLEAIFVRHQPGARTQRATVRLSLEGGVEGDYWADIDPAGRDTRAQVSLMNARLLMLIAGEEDRMGLAGNNLIVDLDLSQDNLPVGQKLAVGEVILQVTDLPHTGCKDFAERFGADAMRFVNAKTHKALRLRGVYARVVQSGAVRTGDLVCKIE